MTTTQPNRARAAAGLAPATNGAELSVIDRRLNDLRSMEAQFSDAILASSGLTAATLIRDAITAVRSTPKLAECERGSFLGALMTAAQLGLRPNVASLQHGWVLPYWSGRNQRLEANWILGYQGMVELAYRSKIVEKITAHTIYEGEQHRIAWGTEDVLQHEPLLDRAERGEAIWHYAVVWLTTGKCIWNAMTDADVRDVMERHAARDKGRNIVGPWRDDYASMARKTALRGLWRFMPKTPALSLAIESDGAVRDGLDAAPVFVEVGEPTDPPAAAPSAPPAEQDGDDSAPAPAEPGAAATPATEPPTVPFELVDGTSRDPVGMTVTRKAYMERIAEKHTGKVRATVEAEVGEWIPPAYLTTAELRRVADADTAP